MDVGQGYLQCGGVGVDSAVQCGGVGVDNGTMEPVRTTGFPRFSSMNAMAEAA